MSGISVRHKVAFGPAAQPKKTNRKEKGPAAPPPRSHPPSRLARMLALAHKVDRLVDSGNLADYAAAARALGITRARVTQVMNLLFLAPEIQERILDGTLRASERRLRAVVQQVVWEGQQRLIDAAR